jgi:hypothetical protein
MVGGQLSLYWALNKLGVCAKSKTSASINQRFAEGNSWTDIVLIMNSLLRCPRRNNRKVL